MRIKHLLLFFIKETKYNKLDDVTKKLIFLRMNEVDLTKIIKKNIAKL